MHTRFDGFRGRGNSRKFFEDGVGDLSFTGPSMTSISYGVRSGILNISPDWLRATDRKYTRLTKRYYLQLPGSIDPRVAPLAREAARGADNPYDTAANMEEYLQNNYGYPTQGSGSVEDPIGFFLFSRKRGHCEYFATAMVLMLRSLGIPARPVNGFQGAAYNEFGDYYAVVEGSAHSWVEAYFKGYGWITFDPTPAVESVPEEQGFFRTMNLWMDALKLRWYKWVVEYDLEKQLRVYSRLWNSLVPKNSEIDLSPNDSISEMKREMKKVGRRLFSGNTLLFILAVLVLLVLVPLVRRWLMNRPEAKRTLLGRMAQRLAAALKRKGFEVTPGTSLPALVRQAVRRDFQGTASLAQLVVMLEEARWKAEAEPDMPGMTRLMREVDRSAPLKDRRRSA